MTNTYPGLATPDRYPPVRSSWKGRLGLLLLSGGLQLAIVLLTFNKVLLQPGSFLLKNDYDGSKGYHWLVTFLRQPIDQNLIAHGQNYPFGEYIFFVDIAPIVSVPLHLLVQTVPALQPYGLYLFDVFFLGGLVLSTLLLVSLFRRLDVPAWLTVIMSVTLPWINPQIYHINAGQTALTYMPAVLLPLWLLQGLHRAWRAGLPTGRWWGPLTLATIAASWVHFYYLGVVGGLLLSFFIIWIGREALARRPWQQLAGRATALLVVLALSTYGLLQLLDKWHSLRAVGSGFYGWIEWKFQFTSLFRGQQYNKIRFPFERTAEVPFESASYLGAFVLFGLLAVGLLTWISRWRQQHGIKEPALVPVPQQIGSAVSRDFLWLLLLASLPLALAALGETIDIDNNSYVIHNYLNPFYWVHKVTERITQFRALGRFIWPFWWAVILGFGWYAGQAWTQAWALKRHWLSGLWVILAALAVVDMTNATHFNHRDTQRDNFLLPSNTTGAKNLLGWADPGRYQAMLPLPYYHSGTEPIEGELYVASDPDDGYGTFTYQLGEVSGLPLMTHRATRAVNAQASELMSMFQPGGPSPELLARLDNRPILVCLDSAYYTPGTSNTFRDQFKDRPELLALFNRVPEFIREQHMRRLNHYGNLSLYEWQPKK